MTRAAIALLLIAAACDESDATKTVRHRSEAVTASAKPSAARAPVSATAIAEGKKPRVLCGEKPGGKAPDSAIDTAAAPGAASPPTPIPFGAGKWIWLNLWAAWCVPCKEEMPRLVRWQQDLRKRGVLVDLAFVSLDDDERQLRRFLAGEPEGGTRASYWLPESSREKWLGSLGISVSARLPLHALVAPKGELRCIIDGALDDRDFPRIAAVLGG